MHLLLTASSSTPEATALLNWILSAVLLGALYCVVKKLTTKPPTTGAAPSTPVHIKMQDYVTRHEFDELRAAQIRDQTKLEGHLIRVLDKMDERDASLTESIEKVAQAACAGRIRIHSDLKELNERVIKVETLTPLTAKYYGKEKDKK